MRKSLLIFLFFFSFYSCNNKQEVKISRQNDSVQVIKEFYEDGRLKVVWEAIDSIPNGKTIEYYPNGNIKLKMNLINGLADGVQFFYYESGKLKSTNNYIKGKLHGNSVYYYENGNVEYETKFYRGHKIGKDYTYYPEPNKKLEVLREYVIVGNKSVLNVEVVYGKNGNIIETTPTLKFLEIGNDLLIELHNRAFDEMAVVVGDYDLFYNLNSKTSLDTIRSENNFSVKIPFHKGDTIRGVVDNFEFKENGKGIGKSIWFSYPER